MNAHEARELTRAAMEHADITTLWNATMKSIEDAAANGCDGTVVILPNAMVDGNTLKRTALISR